MADEWFGCHTVTRIRANETHLETADACPTHINWMQQWQSRIRQFKAANSPRRTFKWSRHEENHLHTLYKILCTNSPFLTDKPVSLGDAISMDATIWHRLVRSHPCQLLQFTTDGACGSGSILHASHALRELHRFASRQTRNGGNDVQAPRVTKMTS
jgi:hypothetical protein